MPTTKTQRHKGDFSRVLVPWCLGGKAVLRGFTLVEVLIVIAVISLLIGVIGLVGVKVLHGQRVALTETTMRNVKMAIDQFAELNPLKNIYDRKNNVTFGPYPPYTLANNTAGTVGGTLELNGPTDLEQRLTRDLSGAFATAPNGYVDIEQGNNRNDDIRALYTYLAVYARDALSTIPDSAKKPLPDRKGTPTEMVNPAGNGTGTSPGDGAIDVLGIYDGWGVPLDYFLYVKLEWDGISSIWRVTQRIPVLRSWGISREEYEAEVTGTDALDPERWIFSDAFPSPAANHSNSAFWQTGTFSLNQASENGWARAIGFGDLKVDVPSKEMAFGYVP